MLRSIFSNGSTTDAHFEPKFIELLSKLQISVGQGILARVLNAAKTGLLAGCDSVNRAPDTLLGAVVYLKYLDEIYKDNVNALGLELRARKHQLPHKPTDS